MEVRISAKVDLDDLVYILSQQDVMKIIKRLDRLIADYDFTKEMAKHFIKELRNANQDFSISEIYDLSLGQ